jgi:hypothetical protein
MLSPWCRDAMAATSMTSRSGSPPRPGGQPAGSSSSGGSTATQSQSVRSPQRAVDSVVRRRRAIGGSRSYDSSQYVFTAGLSPKARPTAWQVECNLHGVRAGFGHPSPTPGHDGTVRICGPMAPRRSRVMHNNAAAGGARRQSNRRVLPQRAAGAHRAAGWRERPARRAHEPPGGGARASGGGGTGMPERSGGPVGTFAPTGLPRWHWPSTVRLSSLADGCGGLRRGSSHGRRDRAEPLRRWPTAAAPRRETCGAL